MNNEKNSTTSSINAGEQARQSTGDQLLAGPKSSKPQATQLPDPSEAGTPAGSAHSPEPQQLNNESETAGGSNEPTRPARKGSLRDDAIEEKYGNYIISFGRSGSGKTTFQSFLLYYLTHSDSFKSSLLLSPEDTATGWDAQRIYNKWIDGWHRGEFPTRTEAKEDAIRELTLSVTPNTGNRTNLTFSFLEIAGELMERILPSDENDPILPKTLVRYLENSNIKFAILLFIDPETAAQDDQLFDNLFSYLDINFPGLRNRISLGIVISKPETSLDIFKRNWPGFGHYANLKGDLCEDYLERMTPRLLQTLNAWERPDSIQIMTMSLGEVESRSTDTGAMLIRKDFNDIKKTFGWLYNQFSGERLGLRWWQKLLKWIRE